MGKGKYAINKCGGCRHFQTAVVVDAYGSKYKVDRCLNPKCERKVVRSAMGACRRWAKKDIPTSGDYCYFIKSRITYSGKTPKSALPCFNCPARCVYSFKKVEKDFTKRNRNQIAIDDLDNNPHS